MEIDNLILKYPKDYQLDQPEEEASSFDVNNKKDVISLINELLPEIVGKPYDELTKNEQLRTGWIIEGILEENFGYNANEINYRQFVKNHVLTNYTRAKKKLELIIDGLKRLAGN